MPCKHCPERLARRYMIHHVRSKHPELPFVCSVCFCGFMSSHDSSQHKQKCSAKMFRHRSFSRSRKTKTTKSNSEPLTCPHCVKTFMSTSIGRSILVKHVKEQHRANFVCRWCFYNTDNLRVGKLHKCNASSFLQVLPRSSSSENNFRRNSPRSEIGSTLNGDGDTSSISFREIVSDHESTDSIATEESDVDDELEEDRTVKTSNKAKSQEIEECVVCKKS